MADMPALEAAQPESWILLLNQGTSMQIAKYFILIAIVATGIFSDQASKKWVTEHLKNKPVLTVIPGALELGYTENRGMVFGINNRRGSTATRGVLRIIRILMSIGLIAYIIYSRKRPVIVHIPLLLILSGAIGNIIDSFTFGHVVDFIHMHAGKVLDWPFFYNLADAYVCIGMGIIIIYSLFFEKKGSRKTTSKWAPVSPSDSSSPPPQE